MRFPTLLAQAPLEALGPIEVTFFKLLALCVMILWVVYLVKEIFHGPKADPRIGELISGLQSTGIQLAVLATNRPPLSPFPVPPMTPPAKSNFLSEKQFPFRHMPDSVRRLTAARTMAAFLTSAGVRP